MKESERDPRATLSRRDFLGILSAGVPGAVLGLAAVGWDRRGRKAVGASWIRHVEGLSGDTRRIGELYLGRADPSTTEAELIGLVEHRVPALGTSPVTASHFRRLVNAAIGRDFAEGKTVRVEGWLLSATEARLAALAHLRRVRASG